MKNSKYFYSNCLLETIKAKIKILKLKCGMPISNLFNMKVLKIKRHFERGGEIWDDYQSYDLCSNCLKTVEEFLQKSNS